MSVSQAAAGSQRPAISTTDQPVPLINTTDSPASTGSPPESAPTLQTRKTGWHARSIDFNWDKPIDRHRYQLKTGLPLVHAAMLNGDWELALELLSPEDLGMVWLAPASQRTPPGAPTALHTSRWASQLPSNNDDKRQRAILEMAIDVAGMTTVDHHILQGANLLTLCLLLTVPSTVLDKVLAVAASHAPQYLHLPDANGRTPLGVAASSSLPEVIEKLLVAGAHPLAPCVNVKTGRASNPLEIVATEAGTRAYMMMLGGLTGLGRSEFTYPLAEDPAHVKAWLARHDVDDASVLTDRFPMLTRALLCFKDQSGHSRLCRMIIDGTLIEQMPQGLRAQAAWYQKQQVSLLPLQGVASSPLVVAAEHGPVGIFCSLLAYAVPTSLQDSDDEPERRDTRRARTNSSGPESDVEVSAGSGADTDGDGVQEEAVDEVETANLEPLAADVETAALKHFVECRSAADIAILQKTLPWSWQTLNEGAGKAALDATQSAVDALQVPIAYRALMVKICHLLSEKQKMELLMLSATGAPEHMCFLFSLPEFPRGQGSLYDALIAACWSGNRDAFEIAAERSQIYRRKPKSRDHNLPQAESTFDHEFLALKAGSRKWFDRFIAAGLDLTAMLTTCGAKLVPLIADVDPDGLRSWLSGHPVKIDDPMIKVARTDRGRQALQELRASLPGKPANH